MGSRSSVAMVQGSVQLKQDSLALLRTFDVSYNNGPAKSLDVDGANASLHRTMVLKSLKVNFLL